MAISTAQARRMCWAFFLSLFLAHTHLLTFDPATDFVSFYAAGVQALGGAPEAVYQFAAHLAAEQTIYGRQDISYSHFFYPPVMLLPCALLAALLSYPAAFFAWGAAQMALFVTGVRAVVGRGELVIPYLAFPAVTIAFSMGQNALLTAGLFALGTAAFSRGRPFLAGLVLGCLVYKPHFGLLLPIAFIAGREWRAVAGAALSSLGLIAASVVAFGSNTWMAFFELFGSSATTYQDAGQVAYGFMVNPYGAAMMLGAPGWLAQTIQGVTMLVCAAAVAVVWRRTTSTALRAAVLVSATMLAAPVILFYDLAMGAVAMAWLAVDARRTGWLSWERAAMVGVALFALVARDAGFRLGIPIGVLVPVVLLALAWRRVRIADGRT